MFGKLSDGILGAEAPETRQSAQTPYERLRQITTPPAVTDER
jgi:hypothetical protein